MRKTISFFTVAFATLFFFSCEPGPIIAPFADAKGTFTQDLNDAAGATLPLLTDCNSNPLTLVTGRVLASYNVVTTSNGANATGHLLISDLKLSSPDGNVYAGVINTKLNSHAAKGEAIHFDLKTKLAGKKGSSIGFRLQFRLVVNANQTATVEQMKYSTTCE